MRRRELRVGSQDPVHTLGQYETRGDLNAVHGLGFVKAASTVRVLSTQRGERDDLGLLTTPVARGIIAS
jgi:hypothetical protein